MRSTLWLLSIASDRCLRFSIYVGRQAITHYTEYTGPDHAYITNRVILLVGFASGCYSAYHHHLLLLSSVPIHRVLLLNSACSSFPMWSPLTDQVASSCANEIAARPMDPIHVDHRTCEGVLQATIHNMETES